MPFYFIYFRFDFSLSCQAAFPANCGFCADSPLTPGEDLVDAFYSLTQVGENLLLQSPLAVTTSSFFSWLELAADRGLARSVWTVTSKICFREMA